MLVIVIQVIILSQICTSERRILDGVEVVDQKKYVVYLTRAVLALKKYDNWICGGAIVSEWYIITSAACVEDVKHLYAIAGYTTYVPFKKINKNICTQQTKKRIVFTCIPKLHEFQYSRLEKWSQVDIAIVKVDTPFDFKPHSLFASLCTYSPAPIAVNYDHKAQAPGVDAVVYGWGHAFYWRQPDDKHDYNQQMLHYAPVSLHDKHDCIKYFTNYKGLDEVIDKYMICSMEIGNINDGGKELLKMRPSIDECLPTHVGANKDILVCEEDETVLIDDYRKNMLSRILERQQNRTRRQGICQNDHGGPVVTYVGGNEMLLGVASVFRVTNEYECTGPFLYTSTQCNSLFLQCILENNYTRRMRDPIFKLCDQPSEVKGYETQENHISWEDHPDGSEEKEQQNSEQDERNHYTRPAPATEPSQHKPGSIPDIYLDLY